MSGRVIKCGKVAPNKEFTQKKKNAGEESEKADRVLMGVDKGESQW